MPDAIGPDRAWIAFRGCSDAAPGSKTRVRVVGPPLFHSPKHVLDACVRALPDDLSGEIVALNVRTGFPTFDAGAQPER